MMYWQYPQVSPDDRLSRAPALDASRITLSPQAAYARLGSGGEPSDARLVTFDGRPAYRFGFGDSSAIVYADDGQMPEEFPAEMTLRIASAWSGQPPGAAKEEEIAEEDQWTVSEEFADIRPLRKYSWADGQQVYVSAVTGDVVQYTTRGSRLAAWFGAIPHWLYFTQLRKHSQQWGTDRHLGLGTRNGSGDPGHHRGTLDVLACEELPFWRRSRELSLPRK